MNIEFPDPSVCDVSNKNKLKKYQKLVKDIKNILIEESNNSIQKQIYSLNWNDTIYRTFNEGVRYMWEDNLQDNLPKSLIDYIHKVHIPYIFAILRKLYEPKKRGVRSVNSIPTIYKIIEDNIGLWTRENYLCYDGLPYEENNLDEEKYWRQNMEIIGRHNRFDKLSGVSNEQKRKRTDSLLPNIINEITKNINLNKDLEIFVNNFLFHASSSKFRPNEKDAYEQTTLLKLEKEMERAVCLILQIGKIVDQIVLTNIPVPQFDPLEGWEFSLFNKKIKKDLGIFWRQRTRIWSMWTDKYWNKDDIYIEPEIIYKEI